MLIAYMLYTTEVWVLTGTGRAVCIFVARGYVTVATRLIVVIVP